MGRIWFTSDTHFNHANIIGLSHRPFWRAEYAPERQMPDLQTMNETMVANWNETVAPDDTIYHLGDFSFGPTPVQEEMARRLQGHKVLVLGNHDRLTKTAYRRMFEQVTKKMRVGAIHLQHHPTPEYAAPEGCRVVLCGHVHESWSRRGACINVGVDVRRFRPVSLEQLGLDKTLLLD